MMRSHAEGRTTTLLDLVWELSDLLGEERRVNDALICLIRAGRLRTASGRTLALASREGRVASGARQPS
jgi:hypothetical protein